MVRPRQSREISRRVPGCSKFQRLDREMVAGPRPIEPAHESREDGGVGAGCKEAGTADRGRRNAEKVHKNAPERSILVCNEGDGTWFAK
jgi:hypothetical protein